MLQSILRQITLIAIFISFVFCFALDGMSEEKTSSLAGHITNSDGKPITDIPIVLIYVTVDENGINTKYSSKYYPFFVQLPRPPSEKNEILPDEEELRKYPPYIKTKTNSKGEFTFADIAAGNVQLLVLPKLLPGKEMSKPVPGNPSHFAYPKIQYVKIGEVSFYPQQFSVFPVIGAVTLGVAPGINFENIELRVNNPLNIRGRIVDKDGTPLADTTFRINIGQLNLDENIEPHSSRSVPIETDNDGFFNQPVLFSGIYAISVNYRGFTAISPPLLINGEIHYGVMDFTLNGNLSEVEELQTDTDIGYHQHPLSQKNSHWIMNPTNGHIYKRINCESREDAATKAAEENAYLVTITNEAEQIWLESVFGSDSYWIGITDIEKEGKWQWDNGEKSKYTNWLESDDSSSKTPGLLRFFGFKDEKEKMEKEKNDFAIMTRHEYFMKWRTVDINHSEKGYTRIAVIEKPSNKIK